MNPTLGQERVELIDGPQTEVRNRQQLIGRQLGGVANPDNPRLREPPQRMAANTELLDRATSEARI